MRRLAILAPLAVLVAACGGSSGGKAQSHSIVDVSKAFSDAGIPFMTQQVYNPYVTGNSLFLPGTLGTSKVRDKIQALLSETGHFNGIGAWIFDTDADAAEALKILPLPKWLLTRPPVVRVHDGNVIIVAAGFIGADKKKLDAALAALK